jgi:imidazole glycerol-phosphate synthase subunit HisH
MGKFVGILDYGAGNVFSVIKALDAAGLSFKVVESDDDIDQAVFLLLPGVGSFDQVMDMIRSYPFYDKFMHSVIVENKPIVGICIGMQILCESSAEGGSDGLGLIEDSQVVYFETSPFKTNLGPSQVSSNTFISDEKNRFYFLHSLHVSVPEQYVISKAYFGAEFPCMIKKNNIIGIQFHPEKSHTNGIKLFRNLYEFFAT